MLLKTRCASLTRLQKHIPTLGLRFADHTRRLIQEPFNDAMFIRDVSFAFGFYHTTILMQQYISFQMGHQMLENTLYLWVSPVAGHFL